MGNALISLLSLLSVFAAVMVPIQLLRVRSALVGLTVIWAWMWALAASGVVLCSTLVTVFASQLNAGLVSLMQLLAAILLLTPCVSILGARKPGVSAWQGFVVFPLILVLVWPGASQVLGSSGRDAIQLSGPALTGFGLVLLMSTVPMIGTTLTGAATLLIVAVLMQMTCVSWIDHSADWIPLLSPIALALASVPVTNELLRPLPESFASQPLLNRMNEAWLRFQSLYGMIWTKRIMDRMSAFERAERWPVSLTLDGLHGMKNEPVDDESLEKPVESFIWTLNRFVSDDWLKRFGFTVTGGADTR